MGGDSASSLDDRLAAASTPDDVLAILGKRRVLFYDLVLSAVALSLSAITVYLVVAVAAGWKGPWVLGWTLPLLPLSLFAGLAAASAMRRRITGKTGPPSRRMARIYERLNKNI